MLKIELLPKPGGRRAKTSYPLRKAVSAILPSSFNEETLSSSDALTASNLFKSRQFSAAKPSPPIQNQILLVACLR